MSTTNTYQGLNSEKNSSRVLQQPGGNSSNIFGHYEEESQRDNQMRRQRETQAVMSSNNQGNGGDGNVNFMENKDSFAANRDRSQGGGGAPFATSGSMVTAGYERPTAHQSVVGDDFITPKQQQAANKSRNQGHGAPFATGDNGPAPYQGQQVIGDDYQTPKQRQANNPNKSGNSFNNLFGDSEGGAMGSKTQGQVSTHNPVTWEAYSNFDAAKDGPKHRSRYENFADARTGTFNPITGQDTDGQKSSTKVANPPGGASSIQF